jgi:hypothetical protein
MDFEEWFSPEVAPTWAPVCPRHQLGVEAICARCGVFCCPGCVDSADRALCEACGAMASSERARSVAGGIVWKLALAPAFVAASALSLAWRHQQVPAAFAVFVVPLACALLVLRTRRPVFAWAGTLVSVAVLGWALVGLWNAEDFSRLWDVAMLAIAPLVAVKGCFDLSRWAGAAALRETVARA